MLYCLKEFSALKGNLAKSSIMGFAQSGTEFFHRIIEFHKFGLSGYLLPSPPPGSQCKIFGLLESDEGLGEIVGPNLIKWDIV